MSDTAFYALAGLSILVGAFACGFVSVIVSDHYRRKAEAKNQRDADMSLEARIRRSGV